jgi:hypothetical protein
MERVSTSEMAPERRGAAEARDHVRIAADDGEISPTRRKSPRVPSREGGSSPREASDSPRPKWHARPCGGISGGDRDLGTGEMMSSQPQSPRRDLPDEMPPLLVQFEQAQRSSH